MTMNNSSRNDQAEENDAPVRIPSWLATEDENDSPPPQNIEPENINEEKTKTNDSQEPEEDPAPAPVVRRPGTISVTIHIPNKQENNNGWSWGLELCQMHKRNSEPDWLLCEDESTHGRRGSDEIVISALSRDESSLLAKEYSIQAGDVLESINCQDCRSIGGVDDVLQLLRDARGIVTVLFKPRGDDVQADLARAIAIHDDTVSYAEDEEGVPLGVTFCVSPEDEEEKEEEGRTTTRQLRIASTSMGWMLNSALSPGDEVVSINGSRCGELSVQDADLFLQIKSQVEGRSDILTRKVSSDQSNGLWRKVRRSAVAVGGGTMLTAGVVLMPTPLHPIGHAMAIGGVGVLGTEFEAPRRAMQSAKESFRKTVKGRKETKTGE